MGGSKGRTVYSTGPSGPVAPPPGACRRCNAEPCRCEPGESLEPGRQTVRVRLERAGRQGKTVTVLGPLVLTRADAAALAARLKRHCGSGGTLKPGTQREGGACFDLELQGEHVDKAVAELKRLGYAARS